MDHVRRARALLASLRETPMSRSKPRRAVEPIWEKMTAALEREGVMPRLARRVTMQLVVKIEIAALGGRDTWRATPHRRSDPTSRCGGRGDISGSAGVGRGGDHEPSDTHRRGCSVSARRYHQRPDRPCGVYHY